MQISFLSSSHATFIYYLPQQLSTRVAKKGPSQIRTGVAGNLSTKVKIRSDNHYLEDISGGRQEQVHCVRTLMDQMVILMTNPNQVSQYTQDYLSTYSKSTGYSKWGGTAAVPLRTATV